MITDTKLVWAEVLSSKQFANRWRSCNQVTDQGEPDLVNEASWRSANLELLAKAHTLGAIADMSFHVIDSDYSDLAFQLEYDTFQWRWETNYLGHKRSSEIISKQVIFPLISLSHMAFSSPQSLSEMSDTDIEKTVDRVGRTARRAVDNHIKHAISKPRVATTIQRMTALFNFSSELPAIYSSAERPSFEPGNRTGPSRMQTQNTRPSEPPIAAPNSHRQSPQTQQKVSHEEPGDSATESESDTSLSKGKRPAMVKSSRSPLSGPPESHKETVTLLSRQASPMAVESVTAATAAAIPGSDSESSPRRPVKKHKRPDTEEDSEEERRKHLAQLKSGNGSAVAKRGVRQPIKRGGKRF
ncbi:hypothetical protein AX14_011863 [Amanita brunnescens Koide BX004]|nr:hypothetical protein AX14_011863 [Amanita brunnescens Koide BX004]